MYTLGHTRIDSPSVFHLQACKLCQIVVFQHDNMTGCTSLTVLGLDGLCAYFREIILFALLKKWQNYAIFMLKVIILCRIMLTYAPNVL